MKPCKIKLTGGRTYRCSFELTMQIIGGKWKPIILYHLGRRAYRPGELRKIIGGITEKMLIQQLRELENDGVVTRTVYREVPPRVEYSLTDIGRTLIPVLMQMQAWGESYEEAFASDIAAAE